MGWVEIVACERSWSVVFQGHRAKSLHKAELECNGPGKRDRLTPPAQSEDAAAPSRRREGREEKEVVLQPTISLGCAQNCPKDGGHFTQSSNCHCSCIPKCFSNSSLALFKPCGVTPTDLFLLTGFPI